MASFKHYVQNLTSLVITDTTIPSTNDITIFLRDGQRNIASRLKVLDPGSLPHITTTVEYDGGGEASAPDDHSDPEDKSFRVPSGIVLMIERKDAKDGTFREAHPINASNREDAKNPGSIHYVTKFNPGFYMINNKLYVIPDPVPLSSDELEQEKVRMTFVSFDDTITENSNYDPGGSGNTYLLDDLQPKGWSDKYRDLLLHYTGIRCLRAKLTFMTMREQDPELVPVLLETMNELKSYYEQGFLSQQTVQQAQQQPQERRQ